MADIKNISPSVLLGGMVLDGVDRARLSRAYSRVGPEVIEGHGDVAVQRLDRALNKVADEVEHPRSNDLDRAFIRAGGEAIDDPATQRLAPALNKDGLGRAFNRVGDGEFIDRLDRSFNKIGEASSAEALVSLGQGGLDRAFNRVGEAESIDQLDRRMNKVSETPVVESMDRAFNRIGGGEVGQPKRDESISTGGMERAFNRVGETPATVDSLDRSFNKVADEVDHPRRGDLDRAFNKVGGGEVGQPKRDESISTGGMERAFSRVGK